MKAKDFYKILHQSMRQYSEYSRIKDGFYLNKHEVRLYFQLDRNPWNEETGWQFQVLLTDMVNAEKEGTPLVYEYVNKYLRSFELDDRVIRTAKQDIYKDMPPAVSENLNSGWFPFYDQTHLKTVLSFFLPLIISYAESWSEACYQYRDKPLLQRKEVPMDVMKQYTEELQAIYSTGQPPSFDEIGALKKKYGIE